MARGTALALVVGSLTVWMQGFSLNTPDIRHRTLVAIGLLVLSVSLIVGVVKRFKHLSPVRAVRQEVEIALQLAVLVYAVIELLPRSVQGPLQSLAYLQMVWVASFLAPTAVVASCMAAVALEVGVGWYKHGLTVQEVGSHVALLFAFAGLSLTMFRTEIARVRRLSRRHIESELSRVKEAARSYRLVGAHQSAVRAASVGAPAPIGDTERLVHSSVEHLQLSLRFMLYLLRGALRLRTAALVWRNDDAPGFQVREASSSSPELVAGPFPPEQGIIAACLSVRGPAVMDGVRGRSCFPLYESAPQGGEFGAVPVFDDQDIVGMLVVHTESGATLDETALELLRDAGAFALRSVQNEQLFVSLESAKTEQGKLYHAADRLSEARTERQVIEAGVQSARQFAAFDFAAVTLFHRQSATHEVCAASGPLSDELVGQTFEHNGGLVSMVLANRHALPYKGVFNRDRQMVFDEQLDLPDMPSLIILPLYLHETPLGTLLLGSNTPRAFSDAVLPTLEVLARHISASLANARMVKRLEELATTDGLTGLLNKRALTEVAREKIRSSVRFNKPLSILVGDIDHFKRVNDTYGHDIGDVVIKGFGDVLRRSKRATDAVGRFGGEEFVVVCEETDEQGALLLAERIRQELADTNFHTPQGSLAVTCSFGVATFPRAGEDWEALFRSTDEALYSSKRAGRNKVTAWRSSMRGAA